MSKNRDRNLTSHFFEYCGTRKIMQHIIVLFGIVFIALWTTTLQFGKPCEVMPNGPMTDNMYKEYANSSCTNGSIWWNYPRGSLQVNFLRRSPHFTVCIWSELGPLAQAVYEVNGQVRRLLENPTEQKEVCAESINRKVTIELKSPEFQTYMTLYGFRVVL